MKKNSLKAKLVGVLPDDVIEKVNRSFEVVGDIAIIEVSEDLEKFEKEIGSALLEVNVSIKTVLKKSGVHHGEFRTQDLVYVAGKEKYETEYLENGVRLKLNPGTVYFSARLSTERAELIRDLDDSRRVLVMFSGAGPYSLTVLKLKPNVPLLTGVEINPEGHKYACESLKLNKNVLKKTEFYKGFLKFIKSNKLPIYERDSLEIFNKAKVNFINGDVREVVKDFKLNEVEFEGFYDNQVFDYEAKNIFHILEQLKSGRLNIDVEKLHCVESFIYFLIMFFEKFEVCAKISGKNYLFSSAHDKSVLIELLRSRREVLDLFKYDEIFMPLPKDAELFLDCAFEVASKGAVVHMYDFVHENEFPNKSESAVKAAAEKFGRDVEIISTRKVGQYSPRKFRVCCDFKILG